MPIRGHRRITDKNGEIIFNPSNSFYSEFSRERDVHHIAVQLSSIKVEFGDKKDEMTSLRNLKRILKRECIKWDDIFSHPFFHSLKEPHPVDSQPYTPIIQIKGAPKTPKVQPQNSNEWSDDIDPSLIEDFNALSVSKPQRRVRSCTQKARMAFLTSTPISSRKKPLTVSNHPIDTVTKQSTNIKSKDKEDKNSTNTNPHIKTNKKPQASKKTK